MTDNSTKAQPVKAAGIDIAKDKFDVAVPDADVHFVASNDPEGHKSTAEQLKKPGVTRVGVEASGHYEALLVSTLRQHGLTVVVLDPAQIHGFRKFKKKRAKTDPIDAALIAAVTAALEDVAPAPDPRLADLAERLTLIEQITLDIARYKTRLDRYTLKQTLTFLKKQITLMEGQKRTLFRQLVALVKSHPDLAQRFNLALSIPGVGEASALAVVIRMPELGRISRGEAASLAGLAPFNIDSGKHAGERHIAGGRKRFRKILYQAAFAAASRWNKPLMDFYARLIANGKPHNVAIVACAKKLLTFINAVLERGTPWASERTEKQPA